MRALGAVAAVWLLVSIPTALVLGRVLRSRNQQVPGLVSDERFAQQAGERR